MRRLEFVLALCLMAALGGCGPPQVSSGAEHAFEVSIATAGPRSAMAWHGGSSKRDVIRFQWLKANGRPDGQPSTLTDGSRFAYEPDLQLAGLAPVVAWYEKDDAGRLTAWLAGLDPRGAVHWRRRLDGQGGLARNPVVRISGRVLQAAWIETAPSGTPGVWAQSFDLSGQPAQAAHRVADASPDTWNLNAAVDPAGRFFVVYDAAPHAGAHELQLVAIDQGRASQAQLSAENGRASLYPDIGIAENGKAAVTWFDERDGNREVYLAALQLGAGAPHLGAARRLTHTPAPSVGAYLAWNGSRLLVVWCDAEAGENELYGQSFNSSLQPSSGVERLTRSAANSSIPSVRASGQGFLIGWNEYGPSGMKGHGEGVPSRAFTRLWRGGRP